MSMKVINSHTHEACGHYHQSIESARKCGDKLPTHNDLRIVMSGDYMLVGQRKAGTWYNVQWVEGKGEVATPVAVRAIP